VVKRREYSMKRDYCVMTGVFYRTRPEYRACISRMLATKPGWKVESIEEEYRTFCPERTPRLRPVIKLSRAVQ